MAGESFALAFRRYLGVILLCHGLLYGALSALMSHLFPLPVMSCTSALLGPAALPRTLQELFAF